MRSDSCTTASAHGRWSSGRRRRPRSAAASTRRGRGAAEHEPARRRGGRVVARADHETTWSRELLLGELRRWRAGRRARRRARRRVAAGRRAISASRTSSNDRRDGGARSRAPNGNGCGSCRSDRPVDVLGRRARVGRPTSSASSSAPNRTRTTIRRTRGLDAWREVDGFVDGECRRSSGRTRRASSVRHAWSRRSANAGCTSAGAGVVVAVAHEHRRRADEHAERDPEHRAPSVALLRAGEHDLDQLAVADDRRSRSGRGARRTCDRTRRRGPRSRRPVRRAAASPPAAPPRRGAPGASSRTLLCR